MKIGDKVRFLSEVGGGPNCFQTSSSAFGTAT